MVESKSDPKQVALGLFIIAAVLGLVIWGVVRIYSLFSPSTVPTPASLAVSAYFDTTVDPIRPPLRVTGTVLEGGKPLKDGLVRLTVEKTRGAFRQSVLADVRGGNFDSGVQPAFRPLMKDDALHVVAELLIGPSAKVSGKDEVFLEARPPMFTGNVGIGLGLTCLLIVGLFFWAFTGAPTKGKNQAAIIFSYCVMLAFLGVPLVVPYFVATMFPEITDAMKQTPVGFVVAKPEKLDEQWVLNIGGYAVRAQDRQGQATSSDGAVPGKAAIASEATPVVGKKAELAGASSSTPGATKPPPSDQKGATPRADEESSTGATVIRGGLVIPLYVIILSIIGGAINMTRQIPRFQKEAAVLALGGPLAALEAVGETARSATRAVAESVRVMGPKQLEPTAPTTLKALAVPGTSLEASRQPTSDDAVKATEPPKSAEQSTPRSSGEPNGSLGAATLASPSAAEAPEPSAHGRGSAPELEMERTALWRQGLLTQHMYLISAPFLAIAVYYLLLWLDKISPAVLVLVSISVGLISDKILGMILGISESIVDQGRPGQKPAGGAQK